MYLYLKAYIINIHQIIEYISHWTSYIDATVKEIFVTESVNQSVKSKKKKKRNWLNVSHFNIQFNLIYFNKHSF